MGLGTYFGHFVSQNGRGHVLGHVKDLGEDPTRPDKVRIYRTNAKYVTAVTFHGLLWLIIRQTILPYRRHRPCRSPVHG